MTIDPKRLEAVSKELLAEVSHNNIKAQEVRLIQYEDVRAVMEKLVSLDYSDHTRLAIGSDIKSFMQYFQFSTKEKFSIKGVMSQDVRDYKEWMQREGRKPATVNRRLTHLRKFFGVAQELGIIEDNPASNVRYAKQEKLGPRSLESTEQRKLMRMVHLHGNKRHEAILTLMLGCGLRAGEVCKLQVADVEMSERKGTLTVRGKGNKLRQVPISKQVREVLQTYIQKHRPKDCLFTCARGASIGKPLNVGGIGRIVEKYAVLADVEATPHTLRHCYAVNLLRHQNNDLPAVQAVLGHSSITTTSRYVIPTLQGLQVKVEEMPLY